MLREQRTAPALVLVAMIFGISAYFYQAGGWNQNTRFDLTRALVETRGVAIDRYASNTGDRARFNGHFFCDKAPGISWLALPAWAAVWLAAGAPEAPSEKTLALGAYLGTLLSVALPTAIAALFLWSIGMALGISLRWSLAASLAWVFGTLALPYATLLYGHQTVAALHISAFAILLRSRFTGVLTPPLAAAVGALLGLSIAVEYSAALGCLVIGAYALWVLGLRATLLWSAAAAALPLGMLLAYHWAAFGSPWMLPYDFSTQSNRHLGWFMGLGTPSMDIVRQVLISQYRGLLYSAPWLALALPGTLLLMRRRDTRAEGVAVAALILLHLWLNASLVDWQGGWALGPRYLVPALPFWVVGTLGVVRHLTRRSSPWAGRALAVSMSGAVAYSVVLMLAGTAVKPEVPVAIKDPLHWVWAHFLNGNLALNTQSIDMLGVPASGPPHAWNLGQQIGLQDHASLLPLYAWIALCSLALVVLTRGDNRRPSAIAPCVDVDASSSCLPG